uniref:Uncharacterized protein n=1 Tax=Anguilla anguilla TaxID=7936 RepID=A0A0E9VI04_ANGAN
MPSLITIRAAVLVSYPIVPAFSTQPALMCVN